MQILEYPLHTTVSNTDVVLIDGIEGTRTIKIEDLANELAKNEDSEAALNALGIETLETYNSGPDNKGKHLELLIRHADNDIFYKTSPDKLIQIGCNLIGGPEVHKNFYRGKNLGIEVTEEQYLSIEDGTFDDLFLGDYWTIGDIKWRIVDLDYWWGKGDTKCYTHHLVIMPDMPIGETTAMNSTATTDGGYYGSDLRSNQWGDYLSIINAAFGSDHVLSHRELLSNEVSSGHVTGLIWADSLAELPNEIMMYGCMILTKQETGNDTANSLVTIDNSQLAWFKLTPRAMDCGNKTYWLRDVASNNMFCCITGSGSANAHSANVASRCVRPVFGICG